MRRPGDHRRARPLNRHRHRLAAHPAARPTRTHSRNDGPTTKNVGWPTAHAAAVGSTGSRRTRLVQPLIMQVPGAAIRRRRRTKFLGVREGGLDDRIQSVVADVRRRSAPAADARAADAKVRPETTRRAAV
ncbi:hypothetical protein [Streptomyces achromogenes]|uniref:hypothetical protein n=1 Tax=Streptomyces achromogenes TaxID=67255 RepID=UPI003414FB62